MRLFETVSIKRWMSTRTRGNSVHYLGSFDSGALELTLALSFLRAADLEFIGSLAVWTGRNGVILLAFLAGILGASLVWLGLLRRQVRNQTAALHEEKGILFALIDNLPDNVYVKDLEGRYLLTNQAHSRFHGVTAPSVFRGKPGSHFFPPKVAQAYADADKKVLCGEVDRLSYEEEMTDGQGRRRQLVTTKVPLRDPSGKIMGLVGFSRDITESKCAEQELRDKERTLSTLLGNLPGTAYRCRNDKNWTMQFLSEGCAELTGYLASELLANSGKSYAELVHPEDRERIWAQVQEAVSQNKKYQLSYRIQSKGGGEKWVLEQGLGVVGSNGAVEFLEGFISDITERRAADEALRVSEERFRAIWEHSIDGMRLTDAEGKILAVNEAFCQLVQASREKLLGQPLTIAFSGQATVRLSVYLEQFKSGDVIPRATMRIQCWNGEEKDVEVSNCFVNLGQGERAILSILRDVSERRRVESVLAYERDLLTTLFDNLPDALYFKDLHSRFVRVSRSKLESSWAMALTRHRFMVSQEAQGQPGALETPDQTSLAPGHLASRDAFAEYIIGKTDFDFFDESRARSAFNDEQEIIRSGSPLIGKIEQTNHWDGRITWSLSTKMPWYDTQGRIIGTFGVSKDITAIKEAEARVELVHRQLVEASREAGMAEVATGVLHNVGNVLNSVNVSVTLLSEKLAQSRSNSLSKAVALLREHTSNLGEFITQDPRGRQLPLYFEQLSQRLTSEQASLLSEVACLAKNIEHIKNIVAMQQTYARPAGIVESVRLPELIEDALNINAGALAQDKITVSRQYPPDLPTVMLDKHKVLQILVNLISNAVYACAQSSRDEKHLIVRIAKDLHRVKIDVMDNGVGIAPENLIRIFNLGFTTRVDGHGFGLHSGALAARELGGCLKTQSDGPGCGATFTLELPLGPES